MIKENQKIFNLTEIIADALICFIAIGLSYILWFTNYDEIGYIEFDFYLRLFILVTPVYLLIYNFFDLYESYRSKPIFLEVNRLIKANITGIIFIFVLMFLFKQVNISRPVMILFAIINTSLSTLCRVILRKSLRALRKNGYNLKSILILGWNENAKLFYTKLIANKNLGYTFAGFMSNTITSAGKFHLPYRGTIDELQSVLEPREVDEVVVSFDYEDYNLLTDIINICEKCGTKISIIPFYTKYLPARPYIDEIEGLPLINIRRIPLDNLLNNWLKRGMDFFGSLFLLILLSPVLLITALLVRLTSPGPIFYKQDRVGLGKKIFTMYKFRSMKISNDNSDKTTWSTKIDDRRTKFGAFIRRCSIDELPQLYNVLKGDMSLVGPRPELPFFVEKFREEIPLYMVKHQVRPGITGWAQINGWRGDTSIEERIKCDIYYIENWTFLLDIKILILTLFKGVFNENAR